MKTVIFALSAIVLIGCASPTWTPKCRHTALMAALVAGEKYPTRIIVTKTARTSHAQAQVWYKGQWQFLKFDTDSDDVRLSAREDPWGKVVAIYTRSQFEKYMEQWQNPGFGEDEHEQVRISY